MTRVGVGDNTKLWDTTKSTLKISVRVSSTLTMILRADKKHSVYLSPIPKASNFESSPLCQMLSKPLEVSNKTLRASPNF